MARRCAHQIRGITGASADSARHSLRLKDRFALTHRLSFFFRAGAGTISTFARRSICSPSQLVHLHGKQYRLSFDRELDGPAPISIRVIATIGITHGRKAVSPSRNPCDSDGTAPISVRVIATIGITHGRKTVSPSRNPCDSDPFWSHSQSSTSVAKLFAFMGPTLIIFFRAGAQTDPHQ